MEMNLPNAPEIKLLQLSELRYYMKAPDYLFKKNINNSYV